MKYASTPIRRTRPGLAGCAAALSCVLLTAAEARAQREPFIDQLIGLHAVVGGAYGDEGPRVRERIEGMAAALTAWDASVRAAGAQLRARLDAAAPDERLQTLATLASVYVNRGLLPEALRELDSAIAIEPGQSAFSLLRGRLLDALGHEAEADIAYARAWELDPLDPVAAYLAVRRRAPAEAAGEAPQVRSLLDAQRRGVRLTPGNGAQPIVQLALIADAASSYPIFAPALYAEGFGLIAAGQYGQAIERLREAAARDRLVVDPVFRSGPAAAGVVMLRDGRLNEALVSLESAAEVYPGSSEVHRILGTAYSAAGDTARAIEHLSSAVRLAPVDERAHLALARALRDVGRLREAEQALRHAIVVLPESAEARWLLGDVLEAAGRPLEAVRELEAAGSSPILAGKAALYLRAAVIYDRHQRFDRAIDLLTRRVELDPNNAAVHKILGRAQNRIGWAQPALVELMMADLLGGDDPAVLAAIGQNHFAAGRLEDAEAVLRRAVATDPGHLQARYTFGQTLLRLGRTDAAREQLDAFRELRDRAMDDQRRSFEIDKLRAEAVRHTSSGHHDMAAAVLGKLVDRMPEHAEFRLGLADALTRSRQFADAVTHLEKAAALGAGPDVHRRLADVYARLGRRDASERARQMYQQRVRDYLRARGR